MVLPYGELSEMIDTSVATIEQAVLAFRLGRPDVSSFRHAARGRTFSGRMPTLRHGCPNAQAVVALPWMEP